jgi:hypothetical protein
MQVCRIANPRAADIGANPVFLIACNIAVFHRRPTLSLAKAAQGTIIVTRRKVAGPAILQVLFITLPSGRDSPEHFGGECRPAVFRLAMMRFLILGRGAVDSRLDRAPDPIRRPIQSLCVR